MQDAGCAMLDGPILSCSTSGSLPHLVGRVGQLIGLSRHCLGRSEAAGPRRRIPLEGEGNKQHPNPLGSQHLASNPVTRTPNPAPATRNFLSKGTPP